MLRWVFDPLHRLPTRTQWLVYGLVAVYCARLALWYGVEDRWGRP